MDRPAVLVLAATRYQMPFILRAREMGWRVVTLDNRPENPGHAAADSCHSFSTTDVEAVLEVARSEKVEGILAACTDVAVVTAARVAQRLGLPGQPVDGVEILGSKRAFREFQSAAGLPHPRWQAVVSDGCEACIAGARLFKPDIGSGSRGVVRVESDEDSRGLVELASRASANGAVVVEEVLEGIQVTCEGIWDGSGIVQALVTERLQAGVRHPATRGHRVPSGLDTEAEGRVASSAGQILGLLKLKPCLFDMDAVVLQDGMCVVLELAPRAGGNCLARLMESVLGYDWTGAALHLALGQPPPAPAPRKAQAGLVEILGAARPSVLAYDPGAGEKLKSQAGWLSALELDVPPGSRVSARVDGRTRCGEVVLSAETREQAEERLAWVLREIRLEFHGLSGDEP